MKFARAVLPAVWLATALAATALAETENAIGIYHPMPASTDQLLENSVYTGAPGSFRAHAVLTHPYNEHQGRAIANVGGFEFRIQLPGNVALTGVELPASCMNYMSPPDFFVGANMPVLNDMCLLANLDFVEVTGQKCSIYLSPVSGVASIPGAIAIADADDEFSISEAVPVSGDFGTPVFGLYWEPEKEDATWGEMKTLYR